MSKQPVSIELVEDTAHTAQLLSDLQSLRDVHPFTSAAITAYRAAFSLQMTRRQNDKQVVVLYTEMSGLMEFLTKLRDTPDFRAIDGMTFQERMNPLMMKIASDIKECANMCDAYTKKSNIAKLLRKERWQEIFAEFMTRFSRRRAEIEAVLSLHANLSSYGVAHEVASMRAKMDGLMGLFDASHTPEEKLLVEAVERAGGSKAVLQDGAVLQEIIEHEGLSKPSVPGLISLQQTREELQQDPRTAIAKNRPKFEEETRTPESRTALSDGVMQAAPSDTTPMLAEEDTLSISDSVTAYTSLVNTDKLDEFEDTVVERLEAMPILMQTLGEIAKIHPFIQVAYVAFNAVYTVYKKSEENNKRVIALYAEMMDMMEVLVPLGKTRLSDELISGRLKKLVKKTAADIRRCGHLCETYKAEHWLSQFVKAPLWELRLVGFVKTFRERRGEISFELSLHLSSSVDEANFTLKGMSDNLQELAQRAEIFAYMREVVSPEQRQLADKIKDTGDLKVVISNDTQLHEVYQLEQDLRRRAAPPGIVKPGRDAFVSFEEYKRELREDPATALARTLQDFEERYVAEQLRVVHELAYIIHAEADRVIQTLSAGPHSEIVDPDLQALWKQMSWGRSVDATVFARTLKEYFREKYDYAYSSDGASADVNTSEQWAIEWTASTHVQSIIEAFDEDMSGLISLEEVNRFSAQRPSDWSLLRWLAFRAIIWQYPAMTYRNKIQRTLSAMFAAKEDVDPINRQAVDLYLHRVWRGISQIVMSFDPQGSFETPTLPPELLQAIQNEEQLLRSKLEIVYYKIESLENLGRLAEVNRIERHVLLLIHLLLERHYQVIEVATKYPLHPQELRDAARSVESLLGAISARHDDLKTMFQQHGSQPAQQFKTYACGLFDYWHDSTALWDRRNLRTRARGKPVTAQRHTSSDIEPEDLLNHPFGHNALPFVSASRVAHFDVVCDNCKDPIEDARIVCLECDITATVNLCSRPACQDARIDPETRPDLPSPHKPTHAVFKVREVLHLCNFGKVDLAARDTLSLAQNTFRYAAVPGSSVTHASCCLCNKGLVAPCWCCITCQNTFLCQDCEDVGADPHSKLHGLVKCPVELMPIESSLSAMDNRLTSMDARLMRIEKLLESLAGIRHAASS